MNHTFKDVLLWEELNEETRAEIALNSIGDKFERTYQVFIREPKKKVKKFMRKTYDQVCELWENYARPGQSMPEIETGLKTVIDQVEFRVIPQEAIDNDYEFEML